MRITKISVRELFGIPTFNYDIELKADARITIIHGPNGSGKTVLFKMISGLFDGRYFVFWKYPFREFNVSFDDGESVVIRRNYDKKKERYLTPEVTYSKAPKESLKLDIETDIIRLSPTARRRMPLAEYEELVRRGFSGRYDEAEGQFLVDEVISHFGDEVFEDVFNERVRQAKWLRTLSENLTVNFIQSNRLLINKEERDPRRHSTTVMAITNNSKDLSSRIQERILEADTQAKMLDRTFPRRVVDSVAGGRDALEYDTIRIKLDELEIKRKRLIEVGLQEPGHQQTGFQIPEHIEDAQQERTLRSVLTMYISDTESKLEVYQVLADKIELFKDITQGMLRHKKLHISKNGFQLQSDVGQEIPLEELSSGEQHLLVLIYNLLFRKKENVDELILIDEPEISLHISWQKRFIDDISRINELSNFDVIIATHSPSIINGRLDLMVGIQGATGEDN